ncbi:helix-turn-helix domain-containing protein [Microbacterium oleivorans]|uniref:Helix-turn-helix domain-containing protein n=1 Tax=Microbacterium oleivorans TaxID=273677 RepID=A0A7D5EX17_9MICO|nr:helix-turn-helix domain-containing protein [Microbacterium oleivorans]QLD11370.1 helix-turn-helix domain-containing protein [Microbacterium oleivorans]
MNDDDLLTPAEAAKLLRMNVPALAQLRYRGGGPVFRRLTARTIVYKRRDLMTWVESSGHTRTDAPLKATA